MITGGGTGGHTSPAVAIIEELQKRDPQLVLQWVGKRGNVEERVCKNLSIPFRPVPVEGWPRGRSVRKAVAAAKLGFGVIRAGIYLKRFDPQLVIGVGGYVSLPLLIAAQRMRVPSVLHEQNKRLGMANRMLAGKAERLLLSYPETHGTYPNERAVLVGNPVRAGFVDPPDKASACKRFGLDPDRPVVLVSGGSQGARTLNSAVTGMLPGIHEHELQIVWMTGQRDFSEAREAVKNFRGTVLPFAFIEDMVGASAAADLVVSRSGASSTAEIAVMGKPSILVPYPHATDNHQEDNARAFEAAGAARVLIDSECSGERLAGEIRHLLGDATLLQQMSQSARSLAKPHAAEMIVDEIFKIVFA
jgi:UDP-N-acetylglucosamine--N-acetylmuramyl-(pentapeptide) pyrophosphoryl-undecaprenol N-acetylglucosamine transferase